jgi:hypothetical protein
MRYVLVIAVVLGLVISLGSVARGDEKKAGAPTTQPAATQPAKPADSKPAAAKPEPKPMPANLAELVELELKLPKPAFKGTPTNAPPGIKLEAVRKGPRPALLVPAGLTNLALGKAVTASDMEPIIGTLKLITDGGKEAGEGSFVELGPKKQWVQIDLQEPAEIYAVLVWHYHGNARVYHGVAVQVADDAAFKTNVRTLFNNDHANALGLGAGTDLQYWETYEGKLIDAQGAKARYVRLWSNGSTSDDQNHYTEVEVWGRPVK